MTDQRCTGKHPKQRQNLRSPSETFSAAGPAIYLASLVGVNGLRRNCAFFHKVFRRPIHGKKRAVKPAFRGDRTRWPQITRCQPLIVSERTFAAASRYELSALLQMVCSAVLGV
jgi:hypothetical protein